ncbi:MAG: HEPN domain-containing protein [Methanomicrobiales archaeon]|nr:HEPN domain-containing protein [Methanomicrobiales archaeon]
MKRRSTSPGPAMIEDLEREGLIKRLPADPKKVADSLLHARRDLEAARTIRKTDCDWTYSIAYNAALQAGRALMFSKGYRPDGSYQHIAVVRFAALFLEEPDAIQFERMRRKRHTAVYESIGSMSETEADSAVRYAGLLIRKCEEIINR